MRIYTNLHRDGITAVAEQCVRNIRNELPIAQWVIAVYGNGRVRIIRYCPEYPPVSTMYCVGPYDRNVQPEFIESDLLFEMQQATREIAA